MSAPEGWGGPLRARGPGFRARAVLVGLVLVPSPCEKKRLRTRTPLSLALPHALQWPPRLVTTVAAGPVPALAAGAALAAVARARGARALAPGRARLARHYGLHARGRPDAPGAGVHAGGGRRAGRRDVLSLVVPEAAATPAARRAERTRSAIMQRGNG